MKDERGSIIMGWLVKIAAVIAIVGVIGFDLMAVATTKMSAADNATNAARIGAEAWHDSRGDVQAAYRAALAYAEEKGGAIDPADFVVEANGTVRVKVSKTATTMVFYRVGASKKWTNVVADGTARVT